MHNNRNATVETSVRNTTKRTQTPGRIETERITSAIASSISRLQLANRSTLYDAHDLVQEVWVRLLSNGCRILNKYDSERGASLEYYVSLVARREANNLLRREKHDRRENNLMDKHVVNNMDEYIGTIPEPIMEARDSVSRLSDWLTSNGISRHGIDILHSTMNSESPVEIAGRLGVTIQIVYNWQHRIRTLSRVFRRHVESTSQTDRVLNSAASSGN